MEVVNTSVVVLPLIELSQLMLKLTLTRSTFTTETVYDPEYSVFEMICEPAASEASVKGSVRKRSSSSRAKCRADIRF